MIRLLFTACFLLAWVIVPGARAQTGSAAAPDLFAELNASLARAVEEHLARFQQTPWQTGAAGVASRVGAATRQARELRTAPRALPARVAEAQRRLRVLGVDAARIFLEEGVPLDLLLVAAVESNFHPLALSPKGARGLWQLMPETARRFGLRVDRWMDERTHPARSTRAAARYLRELYLRFGDWPLALAAYNAGEGRVAAAVQQALPSNLDELVRHPLLPAETRRFVPAVLQAILAR